MKSQKSLLASCATIAILIALAVLSVMYGQYQFEKGFQEGRLEALRVGYQSGYDTGFQDGQLNPAKEIENQIHNRGFETGWQSGLGQPSDGFPDNEYVVLANVSENEVLKIKGSNKTSNCYNLLIENHIKDIEGGYNESLGAGWNGPEFVTVCKD